MVERDRLVEELVWIRRELRRLSEELRSIRRLVVLLGGLAVSLAAVAVVASLTP